MIDQLFYISGIVFFSVFSFTMIKVYLKFQKMYSLINMESLSLPSTDEKPTTTNIDIYKERLIAYRVKTEDDLNKMTPSEITSLYLKHEQSVVNSMSDQVTRLFNKAYTKTMSKMLPIDDESSLEDTLNKDIVLQAAIKELFIPLYYKFGMFLAPLTIAANTAAHIDYQQLGAKYNLINGSQKESKEGESDQQGARN